MKVLYLLPNFPVSPNFTGGASSRLDMFIRALHALDMQIYVWRGLDAKARDVVIPFERDIDYEYQKHLRAQMAEWVDFHYEYCAPARQRYLWVLPGLANPVAFVFEPYAEMQSELARYIDVVQPEVIFADYLIMAGLMARLNPQVPWIYLHHDWEYKLRVLRHQETSVNLSLRHRLQNYIHKQAEFALVRRAAMTVSGSITETEDLRRVGARQVMYIPVTYDDIPPFDPNITPTNPVRIVHFGGLKTTANRVGLERYLDVVHEPLMKQLAASNVAAELWIVGETSGASSRLLEKLNVAQAVTTGYVRDLSQVFRPFDIAIIPYEMNTGNRTKIPLLFAYGQVVVSTRNAAMGSPEVVDGTTAVLVDRLEDMAYAIASLVANLEQRRSMALEARRYYENHFTMSAQLPKFQHILTLVQSRN